ncbi:putative transposase [Brucella rhizosphaerae]|uniref:Putative transposase n=1 Tax=Brucella rhizosphaerae TaxID=571254 RepID=A0A256FPT5_9HYPH|nr:putative transposase [Brucella rhizosphaerae]
MLLSVKKRSGFGSSVSRGILQSTSDAIDRLLVTSGMPMKSSSQSKA